MKLILKREIFTDTYTLGSLSINDRQFAYSCEDADRKLEEGEKKIYGVTAIPKGEYAVTLSFSHHFQKVLPEILNVPQFSGIRIHGGNHASDSLGCILIGAQRLKDGVANCAGVNTRLIELIQQAEDQGEPVTIEVK